MLVQSPGIVNRSVEKQNISEIGKTAHSSKFNLHYHSIHAKYVLNPDRELSVAVVCGKDAHPQRSCLDHNRKTDCNHILIQLFPKTLAIQVFKDTRQKDL